MSPAEGLAAMPDREQRCDALLAVEEAVRDAEIRQHFEILADLAAMPSDRSAS